MTDSFFLSHQQMTEREALMLSPLRLAYVGDAVHSLFVRTQLVYAGGKAGAMHRDTVGHVNAAAQAQALEKIKEQLSETEADVVRRGRNAHAHHTVPKRANPADYKHATGLEALFGFLFLTGRMERLCELYSAMNGLEEEQHAADPDEG